MKRLHFALPALLAVALLASAPADAGRLRGAQVLDSDAVFLMPEEPIWYLTLLRNAGGQVLVTDQSESSPLRVTPLGFAYPTGSTWGSYTATPDGTLWAALSMAQGIRVYDLGDVREPAPLDPLLLDVIIAPSVYDPSRTQMGIIAILIGLVVEPRPSLSVVTHSPDGTSNTMMFGWDGDSFEAVVPVGGGVWTWDRPQ